MFELEVANDLRRQANDLIRQAEEIEKECVKIKSMEVVGKYFLDTTIDTYYRVVKYSHHDYFTCFSLFWEDDNTMVTEIEEISIKRLNQMNEAKKEDVEKIFNALVKYSKEKLFE